MGERTEQTLGCGLAVFFLAFGLVQLWAGWAGLEDAFGSGWAIAAVLAAIFFRFTLPVVVGGFLCAKNIWEWHWFFALLFAAPGLLFMVPSIFTSLMDAVRRR
ncbi:hypothetical protein [Stenotrophomonas indicatrix]|uniref:hypothetical protein n=1 Tax=Stenotrophomonas indicatrix TaxID=2045451 RepID=UPI0032079D6C